MTNKEKSDIVMKFYCKMYNDLQVTNPNRPLREWIEDRVNTDTYYNCIFNTFYSKTIFGKSWKTHLKRMVVMDNPLEYLKKYV